MIIQKTVMFCKNQTSPFISKTLFNATSDILNIQVDGDFNSGLFKIEGRNISNTTWVPLAAINLTDFSVAKDGITKAGIYEVGVVGVRELRLNAEAISGSVTINGQLISTEET